MLPLYTICFHLQLFKFQNKNQYKGKYNVLTNIWNTQHSTNDSLNLIQVRDPILRRLEKKKLTFFGVPFQTDMNDDTHVVDLLIVHSVLSGHAPGRVLAGGVDCALPPQVALPVQPICRQVREHLTCFTERSTWFRDAGRLDRAVPLQVA